METDMPGVSFASLVLFFGSFVSFAPFVSFVSSVATNITVAY